MYPQGYIYPRFGTPVIEQFYCIVN